VAWGRPSITPRKWPQPARERGNLGFVATRRLGPFIPSRPPDLAQRAGIPGDHVDVHAIDHAIDHRLPDMLGSRAVLQRSTGRSYEPTARNDASSSYRVGYRAYASVRRGGRCETGSSSPRPRKR
jgi:hypothetical protein